MISTRIYFNYARHCARHYTKILYTLAQLILVKTLFTDESDVPYFAQNHREEHKTQVSNTR